MNTPERNKNDQQHTQVHRHVPGPVHHKRGRDYGRILRDCNAPAQWYQASALPRSMYFYDPQYQRYLQQQTAVHNRRSGSPVRASRQSPTRARPMAPQISHPMPPTSPSKPVKDE